MAECSPLAGLLGDGAHRQVARFCRAMVFEKSGSFLTSSRLVALRTVVAGSESSQYCAPPHPLFAVDQPCPAGAQAAVIPMAAHLNLENFPSEQKGALPGDNCHSSSIPPKLELHHASSSLTQWSFQ